MLVLSRKVGQRIRIGDSIVLSIIRIKGSGVRIGIEAPRALPVRREDADPEFPRTRKRTPPPQAPPTT